MNLAALLAALLLPGAAIAGTGDLEGRVRLEGEVPSIYTVAPPRIENTCGAQSSQEALRVGPESGLAGCVVLIEDIRPVWGAPPAPGTTPVLDQQGCQFVPHVLTVTAGAPFMVRSSDPVLHNVHAFTVKGHRERFNLGLAPGSPDVVLTEKVHGAMALRCDAGHQWMSAFLYVAPGPHHTVTDAAGRFRLAGVPEGTRKLLVWHEVLGEVRAAVAVSPRATAELEVIGRFTPAPALEIRQPSAGGGAPAPSGLAPSVGTTPAAAGQVSVGGGG